MTRLSSSASVLHFGLRALLACLAGSAAAGAWAAKPAAVPVSEEHARAGERCEAAVSETIRRIRGRDALEVEFVGAKRAIAPTPQDELGVKGEGRYRGDQGPSTDFSYSCAFNAHTGGTSGVVFRERSERAAPEQPATPGLQPDLTRFTPDACESATAAALKDKYPRVDHITFDALTRSLQASNDERSRLEGSGALVRAPGMPSKLFHFRCDFETASGKVLEVQTRD